MSPKPDDDLFIEPASDEDVVYGDYNSTMDGSPSTSRPYIRLTSQLRNVTKDTGGEVRFRCEALGTAPINFSWLKNHAPVEKSRRVKIKNKENSSRLVISDLDVLDSGYYQCVASNAAASVNSTSVLRVSNVPGKDLKSSRKNIKSSHSPEDYEDYDTMDRGRLPDEEDADLYRVPDGAGGPGYAPVAPTERWLDGMKFKTGDCVLYRGEACRNFLAGRHIMITSENREDMYDIDRNLRAAMMFINTSPSVSGDCKQYSQAVACYHMYKVCEGRSGESIQRICRRDCDRLEAEVCPAELALAAEHDLVGDGPKALLPKCAALPKTSTNCIPILDNPKMISSRPIPVDQPRGHLTHWCYVDSGKMYEGSVGTTESGKQCMPWADSTSREYNTHRYPELRNARNFCRNPGGKKTRPWCFSRPLGQEEYCEVPQCPKDMDMYPHLKEVVTPNRGGGGASDNAIGSSVSAVWWSLPAHLQLGIIGGGVVSLILLLALLCCVCCCRGKKKNGSPKQRNQQNTIPQFSVTSAPASVVASASNSAYYRKLNNMNGTSTPILGRGPPMEMAALLPQNNNGIVPPSYNDSFRSIPHQQQQQEEAYHIMEIPMTHLKMGDLVGNGQFGIVHAGFWSNTVTSEPLQVAVKTTRIDANNQERQMLEEEIRTVASFDHPHVVRLLGVCYLDGGRLAGVFEYMIHGDLHEFLRLRAPSAYEAESERLAGDTEDFLRIATQIAYGMEYLASMRFTHRDLATRNCLVGDQRIIKIADFGLMRTCYDSDYYKMLHRAWMPVRWMSKEAIEQGRFSESSDVWAFGVTLWEIFSYGRHPYESLTNQQVIDAISTRQLLECPPHCPPNIYSLMVECWTENPDRRPMFSEIHARLQSWSVNSPVHSLLQQQRAASSSTNSGSSGANRVAHNRGGYNGQRGPRRGEDASPLMRREANYAYSEDDVESD